MIDAKESSQHGEGSKYRLRLYGKGVTHSDLKKKDRKTGFIIPNEFLESMRTELVQQLAPTLATMIVTQLQEANPGMDLVVPDFLGSAIAKDANSAPHMDERNGQSGDTLNETVNQVISFPTPFSFLQFFLFSPFKY